MTINRHNYEDFFLLYVDNELQAEERLSVEQFVLQNPDLKNELDMLQLSVLGADEIVFEEKAHLYKKEEGISAANYENYFLLAVDNELTEKEKNDVEKFVLQHPSLQQVFTLLQKTKLPTEKIHYKNKEELYRKERRLVPLLWMRMSVAAAIISVIALSWFVINRSANNTENALSAAIKQPAAINKNIPKIIETAVTKSTEASLPNKPIYNSKESSKETLNEIKQPGEIKQLAKTNLPNVKEHKKIINITKERVKEPENNVVANLIVENKNPIIPDEAYKLQPKENIVPIAANNKSINKIEEVAPVIKNSTSLITQAAYTEIDTNTDDDKTVYIGSIQINKNKLKGLFKKASGIFGKKDNKEPNDKSVRVAGFEIRST